MADETTFKEIPGTAPVGPANVLFDLFKERRADEVRAKEADITKGVDLFRSGLRMKEAEQQHGFSLAIDRLREEGQRQLARQKFELDRTFALEKGAGEAQAVEGAATAAGQRGIPMPGFSMEDTSPEPGGPQGVVPGSVPPLGAGVYKDILGMNMQEHLARQKRDEERITPVEQSKAETMAQLIETLDPQSAHVGRLRSFIGSISKRSDFERAMDHAATELDTTRKRLEGYKMLNDRHLKIAEMNKEWRMAIDRAKQTAKLSNQQLSGLKAVESNIKARLNQLGDDQKMLLAQMQNPIHGMTDARNAQQEMHRITALRMELEKNLVEVGKEIARGLGADGGKVDQDALIERTKIQVWREMFPKQLYSKDAEGKLSKPDRDKLIKEAVKRLNSIGTQPDEERPQ